MTKKMTRGDLASELAAATGMTVPNARGAVDMVLEAIAEAAMGGVVVSLHGFGTFERRVRAARSGRNPKTGAAIAIPETASLGFRASKKAGA